MKLNLFIEWVGARPQLIDPNDHERSLPRHPSRHLHRNVPDHSRCPVPSIVRSSGHFLPAFFRPTWLPRSLCEIIRSHAGRH